MVDLSSTLLAGTCHLHGRLGLGLRLVDSLQKQPPPLTSTQPNGTTWSWHAGEQDGSGMAALPHAPSGTIRTSYDPIFSLIARVIVARLSLGASETLGALLFVDLPFDVRS